MKAKTLLLCLSFAIAPTISAFAQIDCTNPTNKLVCLFPLTSSNLTPIGSIEAKNRASEASKPINASIAAQLSQLPIPSATVGVISLRKEGNDFGVPYDNLGPILTDRPDTVGRGHIYGGFSFQHFNFNAIDGINLNALNVGYSFNQTGFQGESQTVFGNSKSNINFKLDQYVALVTLGVTRTTDVSVVVPINAISLGAQSGNFKTFLYDSQSKTYTPLTQTGSVKTHGTASGIGDISIIFKQLVHGAEDSKSNVAADRAAVAVGGALRLPSGDSLNYLGSGAFGFNIYGLVEYRARLSPHLKVSYQWNGRSRLVNDTAATSIKLPGGVQYALGTDFRAFHKLTLAADILGSQFTNTPSLISDPLVFNPVPTDTTTPLSLPSVSRTSNTYTTANLSTGVKWSPVKNLLVYANLLTQLNNVGLRSDPVPLFGISYNLALARKH